VSQVNLLPPELLARQKQKRLTTLIIAAGAAMLLLVLGFWFFQGQKLADVNDQIAAQNATNAGVQAQIAGLQEFQQLQQEAAQKQALLAQAFTGEVSFSGILMDLSRVIPSDAYLTAFESTLTGGEVAVVPGAAAPETPTAGVFAGSFTVEGQAAGVESLASWLTRIESVRGWVNAWISSIIETEPNSRLYTFSSGVDLSSDTLTDRGREGATGAG
jgi:Tfp pilus assembly protein PilN